jgi:hypothetical protein
MNSIMERWIQSCRHELLDRTLIWHQTQLHAPARVRTAPQPSPSPSGHCERAAAVSTARTDHRPRHDHASARPPTQSARRTPPRIRTRRLSCTDDIVGIHTAAPGAKRDSASFEI